MTWDQNIHQGVATIASHEYVATRELTYLEAIQDALRYELARDPAVLLMGEDIGVYGGAIEATPGMVERLGEGRVIDTPVAAICMVGGSTGMACTWLRRLAAMQSADLM